MIHSVYSNKEIFLRELISNASDALDKRRIEVLSNSEYGEYEPRIYIERDKENKILTISDNGIGIESADKSTHAQQAQHQSMATKITKERLMVLQKESGKRTSIEIIDKSKLSDQKGTLVRITIPQITIQL